jgi:hypothetical protein
MPDPNDEATKKYISGFRDLQNHKKQYVMKVISQYDITIGVVSHLMSYDIKNELDPLLIERIKNSMKNLAEKNFISNLHESILLNSTLMGTDVRNQIKEKLGFHKNNNDMDMDESMVNESGLLTCRNMGGQNVNES